MKLRKLTMGLAVTITAFILSSCGGGSNNIDKISYFPVKSGDTYEYINREGKITINPQFSIATVFRGGIALVKTTGDDPKWGYINEDGKYIINAQYKSATVFNDGLAWVVSGNAAPTAINKEGEVIITLQDAEKVKIFKEGLAAYSTVNDDSEEKYGFVDKTGKVIINPQFKKTKNYSEGLCAVKNDENKWGYIDEEGKYIINPQFDNAFDFKNDKAVVSFDNKKGVIDNTGKYIINPQFDDMLSDGDNFMIRQSYKWGWCDSEGKIIINPQFDDAFPFIGNDLAAVKSGDNYGYIDEEGMIIINPQFDVAFPFNGDLALVKSSSKIGFIDKEGRYVVNPQYDGVSSDLVSYMVYGDAYYNGVETDYFNINAITSIIDVNSPQGFNSNTTFADIMKKYDLSESNFSKWRDYKTVIVDKRINKDASFNFIVIGKPYKKIITGKDWYGSPTYSNRFSDTIKVRKLKYVVSLQGKGRGKENDLIKAIDNNMNGFKKGKDGDNNYYYKENTYVNVWEKHSSVYVYIKFINKEEYQQILKKNTNK